MEDGKKCSKNLNNQRLVEIQDLIILHLVIKTNFTTSVYSDYVYLQFFCPQFACYFFVVLKCINNTKILLACK